MNKLFSKIVSLVTSVVVLFFVSSGSLQTFINEIDAHAAETDLILGDVNDDNRVDVFDLALIRREIVNSSTSSINLVAADVNIDGVVDVKDAIEIQDFLLCRTKRFSGSVKKSLAELNRAVVKKSASSNDMPQYYDIQVTGDMAKLANNLKTPEAIYKYVANTVNTEFYKGLRKGAMGTFEQNGGNDYDQASLLLAMLTYMDHDASYAAVNATITANDLMEITYTENIDAAVNIYTSQGKLLEKQADGTYAIEQVGVLFNYDNETYFLDPSFKKYKKNSQVVDIVSLSNEIEKNTFIITKLMNTPLL